MSNSNIYYQDLKALQVQRIVTKEQYLRLKEIKEIASKCGFKIFYDIDDLITNIPEYSGVYAYFEKHKEYIKKILTTVDCIVCSTSKLAGFFSKYNKTVVIQNRLFKSIWYLEERRNFFETNSKPRILWAGGHTHFSKEGLSDDDFDKKITNYIKETSERFEWIFCGHKPKNLENVTLYPWNNNYFDYPQMLRNINPDIGIALLQDNDFNKCKSNLKALEYVSIGIPGVYTNITPYQFMSCKINNPDQFIERIEMLTSNQDYYEKIKRKDKEVIIDNLYWDQPAIKKYLDVYLGLKK
jgi:hypothetical protein